MCALMRSVSLVATCRARIRGSWDTITTHKVAIGGHLLVVCGVTSLYLMRSKHSSYLESLG